MVPARPAPRTSALLCLCLGAFAGQEGAELEQVRAILRRSAVSEVRSEGEIASRLAALGPGAVPLLYELVTGRGLERLVGEEWRPLEWACEPEEIPGLCLHALERAPTAAVLAEVERAYAHEPSYPDRLVLLRLLGAKGSAEGLDLVFRGADELGDMELLRPRVQTALREALASILRRDAQAWPRLHEALAELEPATCEVLLDAIGDAGCKPGMAVLVRLLRNGPPSRARVVETMGRLECARPWDFAGQTFEHARPLLRSQDGAERAQAARVLAAVHALEAIPELIELVDDSEPLVRRCALDALTALAALPLGNEAVTWEAWHQRERAWRDTRWNELVETLVSAPPGVANEALRELLRHPLYRHEAASVVAASLPQQPRAVALAACIELQHLGSRWALPGLVAALEQQQPQLRAAAWRTLRALTGAEHELTPALWRSLVDS
jgi:HEAT repeat protein